MIILYYILSATVCLLTGHFVFGWLVTTLVSVTLFYLFKISLSESVACISGSLLALGLKNKRLEYVCGTYIFNLLVYWVVATFVYDTTDFLLLTTFVLGGLANLSTF